MKKVLLTIIIYLAMIMPVYAQAQRQDPHAIGNIYTKSLNMLEAAGYLDTLSPPMYVPVTDIHINHGQIFLTLQTEDGIHEVIYDLLSYKLLIPSAPSEQ